MEISKIYQEDLPTVSDKVLHDKAFKTANNPKYNGCQHVLASMVYKCFDREAKDSSTHTGVGFIYEDQQSAN